MRVFAGQALALKLRMYGEIYIHARHTSSQNCTYTQKQQQCIDGSTLVPELVGGGLKATVLIL